MKHNFLNLRAVFKKYVNICVPYYQRDYVWGSKNDGRNLYKFIDDIFCQYRDNPESDYFIGTLAFCSSKVHDIIDGQQRITSIVLILTLLANSKCSEKIKEFNDKLIMPNDDFIIKEDFYLTEELKSVLKLPNKFNSQGYKVNISDTIDKINNQINRSWCGYTTEWYDNLYNYILDKVKFISLEYSNVPDALKYFLNINSLSIELTQADIFYSIFSQILRISNNTNNIFTIKQKIFALAELNGLNKNIDNYKCYGVGTNKGIDNIIYIFLNSYYKNDGNIYNLNDTGIGKWMSFYKNEVFTHELQAKEFADDFLQYLDDFECIAKTLINRNSSVDIKTSLYTSFILLQYEAYNDFIKVLIEIFKERHDYKKNNIYENGTKKISINMLNEICKRLNLTIVNNYIRSSTKRLDGFITNIQIDSNSNYKKKVEDIVNDISWDSIFNLKYNDKKAVSNSKISDESRIIKVIFALEEAYLNNAANTNIEFNKYFNDLLQGDFTIEHILSVEEYKDEKRLTVWQNKKNKFNSPEEFDNDRFDFEYLTLLDSSTNSSVGTDEISEKLKKYKNAKKVNGDEWEFLPLSLVDNSEFYNNEKIKSLNLPERTIQNIEQNTFELSKNNRDFNLVLLKKAVIHLQQM